MDLDRNLIKVRYIPTKASAYLLESADVSFWLKNMIGLNARLFYGHITISLGCDILMNALLIRQTVAGL
jgi:hypothetical protein